MIGSYTASLAAGAEVEAFDDVRLSKLKLVKQDSQISVGILADATGITAELFAGTELAVPTSPVSAGGTAGVLPKIPDDIQYTFFAVPLDELSCVLRNTTAGAVNVTLIVSVDGV